MFAAYAEIGQLVESLFGLEASIVSADLIATFRQSGCSRRFDQVLARHGLPSSIVEGMLRVLGTLVIPDGLSAFPWVEEWLRWIAASGRPNAVATNGNPDQQRSKRRQLNCAHLSGVPFFYAHEHIPKPDAAALLLAATALTVNPADTLAIGRRTSRKKCRHGLPGHRLPSSECATR